MGQYCLFLFQSEYTTNEDLISFDNHHHININLLTMCLKNETGDTFVEIIWLSLLNTWFSSFFFFFFEGAYPLRMLAIWIWLVTTGNSAHLDRENQVLRFCSEDILRLPGPLLLRTFPWRINLNRPHFFRFFIIPLSIYFGRFSKYFY